MSLSRRYGIINIAYHGSFHDGKELYTMSNVKRKDSKNRNLRNGESQRKDGRYVYKYTDIYGKPQFIYSWKLVPTDKTPAGKRDDISLREKEAQIKKDLNDGIDTVGGKMTVCQLYDKKNSQRKNIKRATEKGRQYLMNALKNDPLGMRAIDTVKQSDAKEWAIRMSEKGYAYKTIDNYKRSLKASFYMAIQDDCIRKNPFEFKLSDVLEDDTEQKVILTPEQEERLLAFMEKDKIYSKYYDETVVLLSHKKADSYIHIDVEFGEGEGKIPVDSIAKRAEAYKPKEKVTYKMIKEYIEAKYGFKVHTAYIAEVKRNLGLPMYDAPNAVEELKQPRKHPTPEKVEAIKDALRYFAVI